MSRQAGQADEGPSHLGKKDSVKIDRSEQNNLFKVQLTKQPIFMQSQVICLEALSVGLQSLEFV